MARSVNKAILIGRLGRDPELKYTTAGTAYVRFSVATDDTWTDRNSGERQERTEWHTIVAWEKLAEFCGQYLSKGRLVYIEGSIQSRQWDDQEGNKRTSFEIRARNVVLLGPPPEGERKQAPVTAGTTSSGAPENAITNDDIPF